MFGVTSIFVNLSETMAGFGFLVSVNPELLSACCDPILSCAYQSDQMWRCDIRVLHGGGKGLDFASWQQQISKKIPLG